MRSGRQPSLSVRSAPFVGGLATGTTVQPPDCNKLSVGGDANALGYGLQRLSGTASATRIPSGGTTTENDEIGAEEQQLDIEEDVFSAAGDGKIFEIRVKKKLKACSELIF